MKALFVSLLAFLLLPAKANAAEVGRGRQLDAYVQCLLKQNRPLAIRSLLGENVSVAGLGNDTCYKTAGLIPNKHRISANLLFGGIAEAIIDEIIWSEVYRSVADAPAIKQNRILSAGDYSSRSRFSESEFISRLPEINRNSIASRVAECAARQESESAVTWIRSRSMDRFPPEVDGIANAVERCQQEFAIKLTAPEIQPLIAINLIRLAVSSQPSLREKLLDA